MKVKYDKLFSIIYNNTTVGDNCIGYCSYCSTNIDPTEDAVYLLPDEDKDWASCFNLPTDKYYPVWCGTECLGQHIKEEPELFIKGIMEGIIYNDEK